MNLTLGIGQPPALPSLHLDASGSDPAWNKTLSQAEVNNYTVQADIQGADLHLLYSSAKGNVKLAWVHWPLPYTFAAAIASTGATA